MKMGFGLACGRKGLTLMYSGNQAWLRSCSSVSSAAFSFGRIIVDAVSKVGKRDRVVLAVTSQHCCINNDEWGMMIRGHQGAACRLCIDIIFQIVASTYRNRASLAASISFPLLTSTLHSLALALAISDVP